MGIYLRSQEANVKLGSFSASAVYAGTVKVWPVDTGVSTLKDGLISLWEMDDLSGAITDAHTNGNHLTFNGGLYNQPTAVMGASVRLDGSADDMQYSVSDNRFTPAAAHSTSTWVYRTGNSVNDTVGCLLTKYFSATGYKVFYSSIVDNDHATVPDRYSVSYWDSADVETRIDYHPGNIWDFNWHHIVTTRDGSTLKLYVDNVLIDTVVGGNGSGKQSSSTNIMWCLGSTWKSTTTPDNFLNGYFDQTGVWNRALTVEEIDSLYGAGNGRVYTDW